MLRRVVLSIGLLLLLTGSVLAQDRNTKVQRDRKTFQALDLWIYNDLPKGIAQAKQTGKPLLIIFR